MKRQSGLTRRQFLHSTTLLAAAPLILPARVWAARPGPNQRIGLGLIGVGTQGRGLLGGFLGRKEVQVLAVCDVDTNRRQHHKKSVEEHYAKQSEQGSYRGCEAYNDFRDLLARKDIDAVVIATPDHWHAFIGIAAAKAGKDIYCEKPLTQSLHEARALVKAVRKHKRVFQVGSQQRSSKEFRTACELVRNGRLGRIKEIHVAVGGPGVWCDLPAEPEEPGLDWDLWLGPAPKRPYNSVLSPRGVHKHFPDWRKYREYGGGMVTDWGAHHFDIAQWGLGMDESGPVEVIPPDDPKATSGVKLIYANGVEMFHENGNDITFLGTEGKLKVNRGKFEFWLGGTKKAESTKQLDEVIQEHLADAKAKLPVSNSHQGNWLECMRSRERPICDVAIGARTVSVCHLCNLAYWNREKFKWDPRKQSFARGTGNPKWLDVAHREPWKVA
jgi:predicted dehydrogenase